jgi:hypothetical protein
MSRLHIITSLDDPLIQLLADDPVRPEIPWSFRISPTTQVFVLQKDNTHEPEAVVCVAYRDRVPADERELASEPGGMATTAVFYTIWSYQMGGGRRLIAQAVKYIQANWDTVAEFVTLSPQTEMARRFHINNGAEELRRNSTSVNYRYRVGNNKD